MKILAFIFSFLVGCESSAFELKFEDCLIEVPKEFQQRNDGTYYFLGEDLTRFNFKNITFEDGVSIAFSKDDDFLKEHFSNIKVYRSDRFFIFYYELVTLEDEGIKLDGISLTSKNGTIRFTSFSLEELQSMVKSCDSWYPSSREEFIEYLKD